MSIILNKHVDNQDLSTMNSFVTISIMLHVRHNFDMVLSIQTQFKFLRKPK